MSTPEILTEREEGVLQVCIHLADKKNALTLAMYAALTAALDEAAQDAAIWVVVLTGSGDSFSSGNDIANLPGQPAGLRGQPGLSIPGGAASVRETAGRGGERSGGRHWRDDAAALRSDLRPGRGDAVHAVRQSRAAAKKAASSLVLPRLIGYPLAAELLLLGEPFSAEQALAWGLEINGIGADAAATLELALGPGAAAGPATGGSSAPGEAAAQAQRGRSLAGDHCAG